MFSQTGSVKSDNVPKEAAGTEDSEEGKGMQAKIEFWCCHDHRCIVEF